MFRTSVVVVLLLSLPACVHNTGRNGFAYYVAGDPDDIVTETSGFVVLQGGGDDIDANYVRMGEKSGGGDFVVLRASGADEYNQYILNLCNCDSVETIVFTSRDDAYNAFVIGKIRHAEALFIAGGDQSNYLRFWKGTPVEDAINFVAAKPAPIGGTSAGMAILGEFSYSAMSPASLTSARALANPYNEDLTLDRDFLHLPGLANIITDQHLIEHDRIGRTVTMLARLLTDGWTQDARAIAADRETAVHLDPESGDVRIFSTAEHETPYVYFIESSVLPETCKEDQPLSMHDISVYRLAPGASFNLRSWSGAGGTAYQFDVTGGHLSSSRGALY
ncbi:MAG TPA: cyanophycinase [Woeseiaceae bacterium]|nr:cyanophycinase [Woeseiaceae bacterium]